MKLQEQRNRWSCLLASFAMVLDTTQEKLIEEIGHDGSDTIWPDLPIPYNKRSFHIQEMIWCVHKRNKLVTPFEVSPIAGPSTDPVIKRLRDRLIDAIRKESISVLGLQQILRLVDQLTNNIYTVHIAETMIEELMIGSIGVVTGESLQGNPHAVAWDGERFLDPTGPKYLNRDDFLINTFWMIK